VSRDDFSAGGPYISYTGIRFRRSRWAWPAALKRACDPMAVSAGPRQLRVLHRLRRVGDPGISALVSDAPGGLIFHDHDSIGGLGRKTVDPYQPVSIWVALRAMAEYAGSSGANTVEPRTADRMLAMGGLGEKKKKPPGPKPSWIAPGKRPLTPVGITHQRRTISARAQWRL